MMKLKKLAIGMFSVLMALVWITPIHAEEIIVNTVEEFLTATESKAYSRIVLDADLEFPNTKDDQQIVTLENLVLDLNGYTIRSNHFSLIFDGHDFVIKNGSFASLNGSDYPLFIGESPTNNVTIENVNVLNGGMNVYNSANVILRNCKATAGGYYAVWADWGANVVIEGGTFDSSDRANSLLGLTDSGDGSSIVVESGNFISGSANLVLEGEKNFKPVFKGGTFDKDPSKYIPVERAGAGVDGLYYVGTAEEVQGKVSSAEQSVEVLKGLDSVTVPNGITVTNKSGETITVNGRPVTDDTPLVSEDPSSIRILDLNDTYTVGEIIEFQVAVKPASYDQNKMVKGYVTNLTQAEKDLINIWYKESKTGEWLLLTTDYFGPENGFAFVEAASEFKVEFLKTGNIQFSIEIRSVNDFGGEIRSINDDRILAQADAAITVNGKPTASYDDGGPFTKDVCGNVFDRWGNMVYEAPACMVAGGYQVPNTGVR